MKFCCENYTLCCWLRYHHSNILISRPLPSPTLRFYTFNGEGLEPIVFSGKCNNGHVMELCDECNNCTQLQFYKENVFRDIPLLLVDIFLSFGENRNS